MSKDQLKAFLEAVKADAGLQDKLKAAADAEAVVAIAKAAGFELSAEELLSDQAEIPDEELQGVAGGTAYEMDAYGRVDLSKYPGRHSIFD
ncbi:Nif11-like leader peptide family RiPP precursor [Synechococcus sp. HK05]|uniref:Nif11-like leader peptide family RiPP precursor n=1 Tax=Synechococcus sp. HK05 TaxID=2725975 RepID=UPI001C38AD04|nr:Nif11-like leader peptide family RiPP precursor [Synechococcus sp. HK05]MBV2350955.1 Nif11-like leader peptide family RiPP precursor [Synechococcus sp. HK05]